MSDKKQLLFIIVNRIRGIGFISTSSHTHYGYNKRMSVLDCVKSLRELYQEFGVTFAIPPSTKFEEGDDMSDCRYINKQDMPYINKLKHRIGRNSKIENSGNVKTKDGR